MSRLTATFAQLRAEGRVALMPYLCIGHPTAAALLDIVPAAEAAGANLFELGVPFSDPLADGATIQAATQRALEGGMRVGQCLAQARALRERGVTAPFTLMGYYNPIFQRGLGRFCADAAAAGRWVLVSEGVYYLGSTVSMASQTRFVGTVTMPVAPACRM